MKSFLVVSSDHQFIPVPLCLRPAFLLSSGVPLTVISAKPRDPEKVAGGGEEAPRLTWSARVLRHRLVRHCLL